VKIVPLDRILLETDAPFMTPIPHRDKVCHSGYVPVIAEKIAEIKNMNINEVYRTTRDNTRRVYGV